MTARLAPALGDTIAVYYARLNASTMTAGSREESRVLARRAAEFRAAHDDGAEFVGCDDPSCPTCGDSGEEE